MATKELDGHVEDAADGPPIKVGFYERLDCYRTGALPTLERTDTHTRLPQQGLYGSQRYHPSNIVSALDPNFFSWQHGICDWP